MAGAIRVNALTAVLGTDLDDTASVIVNDNDGATRRASIVQLRTQLNTGAQNFPGAVTMGTTLAVTGILSATTTIQMENNRSLAGKTFGGVIKSIVKVTAADVLLFNEDALAAQFNGAVTLNSTLAVTGQSTFSNALNVSTIGLLSFGGSAFTVRGTTGNSLLLGADGSEKMRINTSGNFGFGTTDVEAWHSSWRAFQMSGSVAIMFGNNAIYVGDNFYFDGAWKYRTTAAATRHEQAAGAHIFSVAPSGTIDTAITWTLALTIANTGAATFGGALTVTGDVITSIIRRGTADAADNSFLGLAGGGALSTTRGATITLAGNEQAGAGTLYLEAGNVAGGNIDMYTGASVLRARVTNGGVLAVGTTVVTSAAAGDIVLANAKGLRSVDGAGTTTYEMISLESGNSITLGGATTADDTGRILRIANRTTANFPGASAGNDGSIWIDRSNGRLCYHNGGLRYYITGVSF